MKELKGRTAALVSLGCDKNLTDSEAMLGLLRREGLLFTGETAKADIIIINTCGFIKDAAAESYAAIASAAEQREKGFCEVLIVTGCLAERQKGEILREFPPVDAVVGIKDEGGIGEVIRNQLAGSRKALYLDGTRELMEKDYRNRILSSLPGFSYLKIAEGCDNGCSYCTIPSIRGGYRSRPLESLVDEARKLVEAGVKEINIVAQDTALYGTDLYGEQALPRLLRALSEIEGLEWLRLLYCYPEHITQEIIDEMAANPKVVPYIDMPVQHSQDEVLKRMNRDSSQAGLIDIMGRLREKMPDIVIRTTLMVGFPGEGKREYMALKKFVRTMRFDRLGVFAFSPEEGTAAAEMDGQVGEEEKAGRLEGLMKLQQEISREILKKYVGKVLTVLVEEAAPEEKGYYGRFYGFAPEVDGVVFFQSQEAISPGEIRKVKITESTHYDLMGHEG